MSDPIREENLAQKIGVSFRRTHDLDDHNGRSHRVIRIGRPGKSERSMRTELHANLSGLPQGAESQPGTMQTSYGCLQVGLQRCAVETDAA